MFPKVYSVDEFESNRISWWEKHGVFNSNNSKDKSGEKFSMILPPPNVTGSLHLGHAFTVAIEDTIVRWNRMVGKRVLWVPGYDHAGIATQVVLEKKIWAQERKTRHDLGREQFVSQILDWNKEKQEQIRKQLQRLGSSLDWNQETFTMSKEFSEAVVEAFVQLHNAGLIQRQLGLVNWCCELQSAISDIEVNNIAVEGGTKIAVPGYTSPVDVGKLAFVNYKLENCGSEVTVATTRPETLFGDTAIAVHPADTRYNHLVGKFASLPLHNRQIPIIADESIDPDFATGCVKITPAHDHQDYDVASRHNLPSLSVIDDRGRMLPICGEFAGLPRFDARKAVVQQLQEMGLLKDYKDFSTTIPVCSRSGDVIEPLLKPQWYLDCDEMARLAVKVVESGELQIMPQRFEKNWFDWLKNIRKWCISRQLWWGHRIPAYRVTHKNGSPIKQEDIWFSGRTENEALAKASVSLNIPKEQLKLTQDEDVLDTWFSSAIFPLAAFNWPKQNEVIKMNYPLDLLETGHDILFFWVARMVMLCQYLSGQLPFKKVLVHGLLCDSKGRKMSKSLGNVIDPMDVVNGATSKALADRIDKAHKMGYLSEEERNVSLMVQKKQFPNGIPECGADALRFSLCTRDIQVHTVEVDMDHIATIRHFENKIWQACRFYLQALERIPSSLKMRHLHELENIELTFWDKWILSRVSHMVSTCEANFQNYQLHYVTNSIQNFWHKELCDIYLEAIKPSVWGNHALESTCTVLFQVINTATLTLSPFMPFLTEELYQRLFKKEDILSIALEEYPTSAQWAKWRSREVENTAVIVMDAVRAIRTVKLEYKIKAKPEVIGEVNNMSEERCRNVAEGIQNLGRCNFSLRRVDDDLNGYLTQRGHDNVVLHVKLQGFVERDVLLKDVSENISKAELKLQRVEESDLKDASADAKKQRNAKITGLNTELHRLGRIREQLQKLTDM